ncbi:MAG: SEC-C domain-containing protein, partial [Burkholderiales bacterium]|nr:SEC-C domain-containing protein [Burkholderiales bacterium]
WEDAAPSDEIDDLLLPFLILAGGLDHDPSLRDSLELSAQDEAAFIASCQEELSESIQDVYDFWAEVRRPKTVRREEAKVGRNDPCPCGSGRKYKLCHGADA